MSEEFSDDFSDDFVVEDEEESGRPFLIAAGSLILIFIIISGVLLAFILSQQSEQSDEVAAREATNTLPTAAVIGFSLPKVSRSDIQIFSSHNPVPGCFALCCERPGCAFPRYDTDPTTKVPPSIEPRSPAATV